MQKDSKKQVRPVVEFFSLIGLAAAFGAIFVIAGIANLVDFFRKEPRPWHINVDRR